MTQSGFWIVLLLFLVSVELVIFLLRIICVDVFYNLLVVKVLFLRMRFILELVHC